MLKRLIFLACIGLFIVGCDTDDLNIADRNVVSEDGDVPFEELLLLLHVKTSDSTYLVVESIDSVNIFINDFFWTKVNSEILDTSKVDKELVGNTYVSSDKVDYLVLATQALEEPEFNTAGDFADFLNSTLELSPGEYVCFIESFEVTFKDNSKEVFFPLEYKTFKVEENSRSAFVGEIELNID
ncbi:MAG: hypothetical protein AAF705_13915 [Bacteroidota bacterium]